MKSEHQILHEKFRQYGANAREWMRKCVLLLPEIEKNRIWELKRFGSIHEYAAKLAGMSHDTVNDALRVLKKIENMPEMRKVIELKGIGAVKPVENLITEENASFWAGKVLAMSKHTLEIYVQELRKDEAGCWGGVLRQDGGAPCVGDGEALRWGGETLCEDEAFGRPGTLENYEKQQQEAMHKKIIAMELEPEILEQLEKLKGQGCWNELMKHLLQTRAAQLEEQKPEAVTATSRHIPNKIQRYVFWRTNGTCSYPGCKKSIKIKHHIPAFREKGVWKIGETWKETSF